MRIGIFGNAVNGLTLTNVEATANGDEVLEDGVQLVNQAGNRERVTGGTFRDNASRSFEMQNNSGSPTITIDGAFFGNTNFPTAGGTAPSPSNSTANGSVLLATNGTNSASITSTTRNSTFDKVYSIAFFVDMAGNTSQNVTFGQAGPGQHHHHGQPGRHHGRHQQRWPHRLGRRQHAQQRRDADGHVLVARTSTSGEAAA